MLGCAVTPAVANPFLEVASAFDDGDQFDLHLSLDYDFSWRAASIKREFAGLAGTDPNDPLPLAKDLRYSSTRHTLTPRAEVGIFTDLALSVGLPIVISDSREIKLDQTADPCIFPGGASAPTCIDRTNSSTIVDGLLPMNGFDADDPTGPGFTTGETIFRGPNRAGLDQLHLGLTWAPMNQRRDPSKPVWKIGAETHLAIAKGMKFNRTDPSSNTGVGRGVHEVKLWTTMARRLGWADPYVSLWWQAPIGLRSDTGFLEPGFGQVRVEPQQRAGTQFGFEAVAWQRPEDHQRVSIDLSAWLEAKFEGRGYSEMWEIFAYAGDAQRGGPLVLDENPTQAGVQAISHPGVSNIENYLSFAARVGVKSELGEKVRIGGTFEIYREQSHLISFADAGVDRPRCGTGQTTGCEDVNNDVVDPGTAEVNPLHVPLIDQVGHRYRVGDVAQYTVMLDARFLF